MAAWGYIYEKFTGDTEGADEIYALAAQYSGVLVDFAWFEDPVNEDNSDFTLGYRSSQVDYSSSTRTAQSCNHAAITHYVVLFV